MAGKHDGLKEDSFGPPTGLDPPMYPGERIDKAYSEGRNPASLDNSGGHPIGTPEANAYQAGFDNKADVDARIQTCWV